MYPDSGSLVAPPKVNMFLLGGKRKEGSKPTRRKKKSKSENDSVVVVHGPIILHWEMGKNEENA